MKLTIAILAFMLCLNLSGQKEQVINSKWFDNSSGTTAPVPSDYFTGKKEVLLYSLSNDNSNLYVDIKITESIEQNKVLQMGLILWVNTDGKSRKITGIRYPIGAKFSRSEDQNNMFAQETPLSKANTIELIGFKDVEVTKFPSNNSDNFRGYVKYDNDGNLLYSMTIPMQKLPPVIKSSDEKSASITLAIEYGVPPETGNQSGKPSGYTPPPAKGEWFSRGAGRGGSAGTGSKGGGTSGKTPKVQDAPKPVIIWIKEIVLAEKK